MASYATPADMLARYDVRHLGDLVSDSGQRIGSAEVLSHTNLQTALDDAAGEIEAALMQGQRYSADDLTNLTGNSKQYLIRLNCAVAISLLWQRRPWSDDDKREDAIEKAREALDKLRKGITVLNVEAAKDAGLPAIRTPSLSRINRQNLVVDRARAGYYPTRLLPGQVSS
jgi:phage gp36-like protein